MPAKIKKLKSGKYQVKTPNAIHAKRTTLKKAKAQQRLINAIDHGWHPTGKKARHESKELLAQELLRSLLDSRGLPGRDDLPPGCTLKDINKHFPDNYDDEDDDVERCKYCDCPKDECRCDDDDED